MRTFVAACGLLALACAAVATPTVPKLSQSWSGGCNTTMTLPFIGKQTMVGNCYYDGALQRTRQDGTVSTPFGNENVINIHWWDQTYSQCTELQGASDCSYFDPTHMHSVDYQISASPFGGSSTCTFTYKENVDSVACTTGCQEYPNMQIPPNAQYTTSSVNGVAADLWTWNVGVKGLGQATWAVYVQSSSPTTLLRFQFTTQSMGSSLSMDTFVTNYDPTTPSASVFTDAAIKGCKLQTNDDDDTGVVAHIAPHRSLRG